MKNSAIQQLMACEYDVRPDQVHVKFDGVKNNMYNFSVFIETPVNEITTTLKIQKTNNKVVKESPSPIH